MCYGQRSGISRCSLYGNQFLARSEEMTIVSWIDGGLITPNTTGVTSALVQEMNNPITCYALLGQWFVGSPRYAFPDTVYPEANRRYIIEKTQ